MITIPSSVRIYLSSTPIDMRTTNVAIKSIEGHDGLAAMVQQQMRQDVYSGHLFVFVLRIPTHRDHRFQSMLITDSNPS